MWDPTTPPINPLGFFIPSVLPPPPFNPAKTNWTPVVGSQTPPETLVLFGLDKPWRRGDPLTWENPIKHEDDWHRKMPPPSSNLTTTTTTTKTRRRRGWPALSELRNVLLLPWRGPLSETCKTAGADFVVVALVTDWSSSLSPGNQRARASSFETNLYYVCTLWRRMKT